MVPESALMVWQLRGFVEDIHCFFYPRRAGFALGVERAGERLVEEYYDDVKQLMVRARQMKDTLVNAGFEPLHETSDGPSLDWLLPQFVRAGTAPVRTLAARAC
jgi:hypothetical protein